MGNALRETEVAAALDEAHARAQQAFEAKDLETYMSIFAPELVYTRMYGQVIDRTDLSRDVEKQLLTLEAVETSFRRESLELTEGGAAEVLVQNASGRVSAFGGLVGREWKLLRDARYVWENRPRGWCIVSVEVRHEAVSTQLRLGR